MDKYVLALKTLLPTWQNI